MIRLETHKQLGSFTMPQFLPSNHNHSQVLPQTAGFRTPEEVYLLLETFSLKFKAKPKEALRAVSVCSLAHGRSFDHFPQSHLTNGHRSPFWEYDGCSGIPFLPSLQEVGAGFECPDWLLHSRKCVWLLSNSSLPPPMTLTFAGSFRELGHLNSISCVLFCLPTLSPPLLCCAVLSHSVATLWTVARQAPMSMGFSRQEYWSGLPFSSPMD